MKRAKAEMGRQILAVLTLPRELKLADRSAGHQVVIAEDSGRVEPPGFSKPRAGIWRISNLEMEMRDRGTGISAVPCQADHLACDDKLSPGHQNM